MMLLRLLLANMTCTKVSHKEAVQSSSDHLILQSKQLFQTHESQDLGNGDFALKVSRT